MAENKVQLSTSDRMSVCMRHQFLQGSWNYERMQNGGWCFAMIPAIKKLYSNKEDQIVISSCRARGTTRACRTAAGASL